MILSRNEAYRKHVGAMAITTNIGVQIRQDKSSGSRFLQVGAISAMIQVSLILSND